MKAADLPGIHPASECGGDCPFHRPSEHHMRDWPITIRNGPFDFRAREIGSGRPLYLTERICSHGVGHPDPDSLAFLRQAAGETQGGAFARHGCDGCCLPPGYGHEDHQRPPELIEIDREVDKEWVAALSSLKGKP